MDEVKFLSGQDPAYLSQFVGETLKETNN